MIGAILGDVIGSIYESSPVKNKDFTLLYGFSRFTDDTVLTIAVADAILNNKDYSTTIKEWGKKYPRAGYGGNFWKWMMSENTEPYNSWGNGSAMRVSPVGFAYNTLDEVLYEAKKSAEVTHNHPEGIKGAQATASAIFLARTGSTKQEIKDYVETHFDYNLSRTLDEIRPSYHFDISCQGSVPESIIAFLESEDYEDAIRNTISLGGDADTMGSITGGIAQAFYKEIPQELLTPLEPKLTPEFWEIIKAFNSKYGYL